MGIAETTTGRAALPGLIGETGAVRARIAALQSPPCCYTIGTNSMGGGTHVYQPSDR